VALHVIFGAYKYHRFLCFTAQFLSPSPSAIFLYSSFLITMGIKCCVKRAWIYSSMSSSSSSEASTPSPSPPPPSLSWTLAPEGSSQGLPSIQDVYGVPPEGFLAASPESEGEEEDWGAPNTSRDEEFTRKLSGELNWDLLGPPGDNSIIIISNSDEEEDDLAGVSAVPSSPRVPSAPPATTTEDDGTPD
jgi:hypothetical protein